MSVFEEASEARVVAGGTWSMIGGMIVALISWLFVVIGSWETIGFGKEVLFYYLYYGSIVGSFSFFTVGISQGIVREIAAADAKSPLYGLTLWQVSRKLLFTIGVLLFAGILILSTCMWFFAILPSDIYVLFIIAATVLLLQMIANIYTNLIGAHHRFDTLAKINVLSFSVGFGYLFILLGVHYYYPSLFTKKVELAFFLFSYPIALPLYGLIATVIGLIVGKIAASRIIEKVRKKISFSNNDSSEMPSFKKLLSIGLLSAVTTMVVYGLPFQINQFLLGLLGVAGGDISTYIIAIGYSMTALYAVNFIPAMIPEISRAVVRKDWNLINRISRSMVKIGGMIGSFAAIEGIVLGTPIMLYLHGPGYIIGGDFLRYQGVAAGLLTISAVLGGILVGLGLPAYSAIAQGIGLAGIIGTEIFLVPRYGALGGAIALLVGSIIAFPLALIFAKVKGKVKFGVDLWPKFIIAVIITTIAAWLVPVRSLLMLFVAFVVSIGVGLLAIALVGLVEKEDMVSAFKTMESLKGGFLSKLLKLYGYLALVSPLLGKKRKAELREYLRTL